MITGINESKTLKHISCEWNVNLMEGNLIQIKVGITINVDMSVKAYMWKRLFFEFCYM